MVAVMIPYTFSLLVVALVVGPLRARLRILVACVVQCLVERIGTKYPRLYN